MSDTQTADRFLTVAKFVDETGYSDNADRNRNRNAINTALAAPVQKEGTNDNTNET